MLEGRRDGYARRFNVIEIQAVDAYTVSCSEHHELNHPRRAALRKPCAHILADQEASCEGRQGCRSMHVDESMFEEPVNQGDDQCRAFSDFRYLRNFSTLESVLTISILWFAGVSPCITGRAFLSRIRQLSECSASAFVVGAIYLERLRRHDASVMLSVGTFRRLFLVSVMIAAKFLDDQHVSNRQVSILCLRI